VFDIVSQKNKPREQRESLGSGKAAQIAIRGNRDDPGGA